MSILASPLDVTDEWLSEIVGCPVEIVANEPIADAGIISPVARLRLNSGLMFEERGEHDLKGVPG